MTLPLCIFCRKERELTEEHIIPDCIGGSLKPKLLCKGCNSTLGSTIDGPFSNSVLVQLPRQSYQIPGKSGTVPNPFGDYGTTSHEGKELNVRLDEQFKPYIKPIITEQRLEQALEISITIDKEDEGDIESILRKKITRYYRSLDMPDDEIQTKVAQYVQDAKKTSVPVSHQPTIKYSFPIDINVLVLESIKIAEAFRCALRHQRRDGIACAQCIDLGPLKAILPGQDAHFVLLLHNSCVVSIFGIASVIEYCGEGEAFARSIEHAVLYVFNPANRSHARHLLANFLSQHANRNA
jgi:hypothetical protein